MARTWALRAWLRETALRVMVKHIDFMMGERHFERAEAFERKALGS